VLHACDCVDGLGQAVPPCCGAVVVVHVLDCKPPPQISLHAPHPGQLPTQFMGSGGGGGGGGGGVSVSVAVAVAAAAALSTSN